MAYTYHGFGALDYGKREFRSDGSYITTSWLVCFYLPIVPMSSKRIAPSGNVKYYGIRPKRTFVLYEKTKPNLTQVFSVYTWFAAELAIFITADVQHTWWIASPGVLLLVLPWWLRQRDLERVKEESLRREMGLSPTLPE